MQGINTLRFKPDAALFSGNDATYNYLGRPIPAGLFNISTVPMVRYGGATSIFASQPYMQGVDPTWTDRFVCSNCPTDASNFETFVDIEPVTGATLQGSLFGQMNVRIGMADLYHPNCSQFDPQLHPYACISDMFLPVLMYSRKSALTPGIADALRDNLNQAKMGAAIMQGTHDALMR